MKTWKSVWPRLVVLALVATFFAASADAGNRRKKKWREEKKRIEAIQSIAEVWETILAGGQHSAFRALDRLSEELREVPEKTEEAMAVLRKVRLHLAENREADEPRVLLCRLRAIVGAPAEPSVDPATVADADRPSSAIQRPRRIYNPTPGYTVEERKSRVQGTVSTKMIIDPEGCVASLSIVQSLHPALDEATRQTLLTWVFRPAQLDGKNVTTQFYQTTTFRLQ